MSDDKLWLESINDLIIDEDKVKKILLSNTLRTQFSRIFSCKLVSLFKELKNNHNSYFDECVASIWFSDRGSKYLLYFIIEN